VSNGFLLIIENAVKTSMLAWTWHPCHVHFYYKQKAISHSLWFLTTHKQYQCMTSKEQC